MSVNDTFHFIDQCALYNYTDDKTLCIILKDYDVNFRKESNILISWFSDNFTKASYHLRGKNARKYKYFQIGQTYHKL